MTARSRRVLLTGARGFIGRRCLPLLEASGFEIHAVSSREVRDGGAAWHRCDLLDGAACEALLAAVRPSHLLHLAWIAQPGIFWTSPANADWLAAGTRLVQRFYGSGGLRAVGVGSCAEYGASALPCREQQTPIAPDTAYGKAKAAMCAALGVAAGAQERWAWARLFFPYGPGEPSGRFIPNVIEGLLRRAPVACTEGRQVRDFVYVDDVAGACVALLDTEAGGIYNVGSGEGRSLREVASAIVAQLGRGELLRFGERAPPAHDRAYVVADIGRLRSELGWSPQIGLQEGIRRSIAARSTLPDEVP